MGVFLSMLVHHGVKVGITSGEKSVDGVGFPGRTSSFLRIIGGQEPILFEKACWHSKKKKKLSIKKACLSHSFFFLKKLTPNWQPQKDRHHGIRLHWPRDAGTRPNQTSPER
jgi:hypothetical protein